MNSNYDNVIDIYNKLCDVHDELSPQEQDGFAKALYLLSNQLSKLVWINFHIENKRLSKALYMAKLRVDDLKEDNQVLIREINALKGQKRQLQNQLNLAYKNKKSILKTEL